ncbi:apolipoprotein N-acyltransferase [Corynebacterium anserum]
MFRLVLAAFSGLMLYASFQPTGLWWAAPIGFALFFLAVTSERAIVMAWLQGAVLYLLLLPWVGEFVGWYAWVALAAVQSLYSLLFGLGLRYALRRPLNASRFQVFTSAIAIAAWFTATEWLRSSWPFGGFPWGRIAWGQVGGPLGWWVQLGGPALVSFITVFSGIALAWTTWFACAGRFYFFRRYTAPSSRLYLGVPAAIALVVAVGIGTAVSINSSIMAKDTDMEASDNAHINVAAIQGNVPRLGLDFAAQRRAVLDNHARLTHTLAEEVRAGKQPQPDLVIWPENASDVNPFTSTEAAEIIQSAVDDIRAPILLGTVSPEHNSMYAWGADGPGDVHNKRYLQPFGEYMPFRDLLRMITPLVDRAGNFQPGSDNGVVTMEPYSLESPSHYPVEVGVATCYEIAFDGATRRAINGGAQILTTPTNNATFGFTDMTYQQLAMSRMRAMEYDRSLVVAATSGVSAIINPDGSVVEHSTIFQPAILSANLSLRDSRTISAYVGPWVEWVLSAMGICFVIAGFAIKRCGVTSGKNEPTRHPNRQKAQ